MNPLYFHIASCARARMSLVVGTYFITLDSALMNSERRSTAICGQGDIDSVSSLMP